MEAIERNYGEKAFRPLTWIKWLAADPIMLGFSSTPQVECFSRFLLNIARMIVMLENTHFNMNDALKYQNDGPFILKSHFESNEKKTKVNCSK